MKTSWYILSTIVLLAVWIDGSHGLSCYNCTNIADITGCKQVVQCNTDEFCYTQTTGYVGDQTRFTQGCRQKQICRHSVLATQPSPNIIGRDVASQVDCNECCGIDNCNSHLCNTGAQALNQAQCVDDPEFDCQQFDGFLHLCSDITHAKQKCQRYCGLCTIVDGSWSSWQSWSSCDRTCGNGTQTRTRACDNPASQDGGLSCPNVDHEINVCVLGKCPVHGGWATWSSWGSCSATCGMGLQRRDRSCSHPYPGPDGNPCFGDYRDDRACFDGACADGLWSAWSGWGTCSASCLGGLSSRTRNCNKPSPSRFGHDCVGNSEETKICNTHYCQDAHNGGWSRWSKWTNCTSMFGKQTRTRSCTNPSPSGFGHACSGTDWQTQSCGLGANGMRYIYLKRDELTKNHQLDTNTADGRMYEVESQDERCPLKTFVKYKRMLPPGNTYLFPRVLKTATKSGYYFSMQLIGQNKLGTMMSNLSIKAGLSQNYTNLSLRATSVHVLDSAQVPTRHIMSVTGHKCENSLKTYTGFTDSSTKQMMSHTISKCLGLNVNSENKENSMDVQNSNTALNTIESLSIGKAELEEFAPTEDSEMDIGDFDVFDDVQFDDLIRSMEVPNENEFIANNLGDSHRHNLQTLQNQNQTVQAMRQSTDINMGQNQNQTVQAMRQSTDINMRQNQNQTVQAMRQSTDINMGHSRPKDINMRHISDINMRQTFNNPRFGLSAPTISNCNVTINYITLIFMGNSERKYKNSDKRLCYMKTEINSVI